MGDVYEYYNLRRTYNRLRGNQFITCCSIPHTIQHVISLYPRIHYPHAHLFTFFERNMSHARRSCRDDESLSMTQFSRRIVSSPSPRRIPPRRRRREGRRAAELRQLQSVGRLRRRRGAAVRPRAGVAGGGAKVVGLARRREARVPVRLADAESSDEPLASRFGRPSQEQVEHRTLPAEYEEHEHAAERVDGVRGVPVVSGRLDRPRDHFENERHAHQAEQL